MVERSKIFRRFPLLPWEEVLERLNRAEQAGEFSQGEESPRLEVVLNTGQSLRGRLVAYDSTRNRLLLRRSDDNPAALDMTYLDTHTIVGVQLEATDAVVSLLAPGLTVPKGPPPGKLDLARTLQAAAKGLPASVVWSGIPDDEFARAALAQLIENLRQALDVVLSDELGRASFSEKIHSLEICRADTPQLKLSDTVLSVGVCPAGGVVEIIPLDELTKKLEALL